MFSEDDDLLARVTASRFWSVGAHGFTVSHFFGTDEWQLNQLEEELSDWKAGRATDLKWLQKDVPHAAEESDRVCDEEEDEDPGKRPEARGQHVRRTEQSEQGLPPKSWERMLTRNERFFPTRLEHNWKEARNKEHLPLTPFIPLPPSSTSLCVTELDSACSPTPVATRSPPSQNENPNIRTTEPGKQSHDVT